MARSRTIPSSQGNRQFKLRPLIRHLRLPNRPTRVPHALDHLAAPVRRIVLLRNAGAMAVIAKNPPSAPVRHAVLALQIVPLRSAEVMVEIVMKHLTAPGRHPAARDRTTARISPSDQVRLGAQPSANAPGREIAPPVLRIAQVRRVVRVLPDVPALQVAAARESPAVRDRAGLAKDILNDFSKKRSNHSWRIEATLKPLISAPAA